MIPHGRLATIFFVGSMLVWLAAFTLVIVDSALAPQQVKPGAAAALEQHLSTICTARARDTFHRGKKVSLACP